MATQVKLNQLIQDAATDGQVITWDNALSKWKPGTPTGGAGSSGDYGYIQYSDGAGGFLSDTPNLFWDDTNQLLGIGVSAVPTAKLHIAGSPSGAANTASLKFDLGVLLDTPEAGSVEYDGDYLYYTDSGDARWRLLSSNDPALADGNKGDITVSSGGTVWQINDVVITNSNLDSSVGGIYKGTGDIPENTTAHYSSATGHFDITYDNNFPAIRLDADNQGLAFFDYNFVNSMNMLPTEFIIDYSGGNVAIWSTTGLLALGFSSNNTFTDLRASGSQAGIEYADWYHPDYTDRSLVDKQYVDNAVSAATDGNGIYTGSGTIETGTTALLASGSSLYFNYSGNFAGIFIADNGDDATGLIGLNSYDQNTQVTVSNGQVYAATDELVTLRSPLYSIGHGALGDIVMELGRGCSSFKMQFFEPSGFTNYTEFSAGDQSAIISYIFPLTEGTDGQVMTWNTGGQLSWETPTTGAPSSGIAGAVQFSDGSGGFSSDATNFFFNDSTNQLQLKGGSAYNLAITGSAVGGVSVVPASTVTGDYVNFKGQVSATGLSDLQITNTNTSNSGAHSRIQLQTGTGGGDPFLRFLSNEIVYIMGFDQSASKFVIGTGDDPSTMTDTNVTLTGKHLGVMQTSPTAYLHLGAGTATANTAPIKLTTGTALATPEDGAIEYHGSHIYFTIGSTRYQLDQQGGGISDVDYGDITVSSSGSVWTIDNTAVTLAKIANATANNKLLGSGATGSGSSYEQISIGSDLTMTGTTLSVTAATTSLAGKVELATTSETTIGTDTTRAVTPKGLSESVYGAKVVTVLVTDPNGADLTTGDGKVYIPINGWITGMNLIDCSASVSTASTSGLPTVQLRRVRSGTPVDILTTKITIDANEVDSSTATTPFAINTSNDDMLTGDQIYIDVDVAGTGTKGLAVTLVFQTP